LKRPLKILLVPLDWGLGHATRCIPIIRYLLEKQCDVTVAADGQAALLLRGNFPDIKILPVEGYKVRYSRGSRTFALKILTQVPKILKAIRSERRWLAEVQGQNKFDLVISDNRYGLKIAGLTSVIMTHQIQVMSGAGDMIDRLLLKLHCRILEKFDQCWVVDHQGQNNIGGQLSHPELMPSDARYIGLLSQLTAAPSRQTTKEGGVLVLLSGPEPQRTILEQRILSQITGNSKYQYIVVGGNPGGVVPDYVPSGTDYYTHLNALQLQTRMENADLVICRSGYSTLMDLAVMGKKALLIPTPGQSEQEYLAGNLTKRGLFFSTKQALLDLQHDIPEALKFPGFIRVSDGVQHQKMKEIVDELVRKLRA